MPPQGARDDQLVEVLKAIPIFGELSQRELRTLARTARAQSFGVDDVICREGHSGVGLHIVETGGVEVSVGGEVRRQMGPGAFFGEIALLDGGPRSATVVATKPTTTVSLTAWDFKALLDKHPEIGTKMLPELCRRLRQNEESVTH